MNRKFLQILESLLDNPVLELADQYTAMMALRLNREMERCKILESKESPKKYFITLHYDEATMGSSYTQVEAIDAFQKVRKNIIDKRKNEYKDKEVEKGTDKEKGVDKEKGADKPKTVSTSTKKTTKKSKGVK